MKDWYLRFILTIIAACLVFQVVESCAPEPAVAGSSGNVQDVRIVDIGDNWSYQHRLPVEISGIKEPPSYGDWDKLPVENK